MRKRMLGVAIIFVILMALPSILMVVKKEENISRIDTVEVNELLSILQRDWNSSEKTFPQMSFNYAVIDNEENLLYKDGGEELAEGVNKATRDRDTIRDIVVDGETVGKVIIYNNMSDIEMSIKRKLYTYFYVSISFAYLVIIGLLLWIDLRVVRPFDKMKDFATAVAGGDLDKPLVMDRENIFGAFTQSFDIMREQLEISREKELQANISKKELVAQLSHDIKTPVASIKAMSEVLEAKEEKPEVQEKLHSIGAKADQIDSLVSNLFVSTLEELEKLEVNVSEMESTALIKVINDADYNKKVKEAEIQECMITCDKLRVTQVINNIIYNSYKYADTDIYVNGTVDMGYLYVSITDRGGGVTASELSLITQKYKRGGNASEKQGAGLGLFIARELMENMQGSLEVANADGGFRVTLGFKLA